uniref:Iron sulphur domain-containing protein n=1 Tax=Spermophilus dauricus TaxID=99837 RepID=A0A8C9Q7E5_SPEDA
MPPPHTHTLCPIQSPSILPMLPPPQLLVIDWVFCFLVSEWLRLLPFLGVLALLGYLAVRPFFPKKKQQKDSLINLKIQKENPKVVNEINIEDLCLTKAAYCRCWRSKTVRCLFTCTVNFCGVKNCFVS